MGFKATPELYKALVMKGFNTLYLPIEWEPHMDENLHIDTMWLDRVEEVVNYALDAGMYVCIDPFEGPGDKTQGVEEPVYDYDMELAFMTAVWTQVAERFKNYPEHLLFQTINEPGFAIDGWLLGNGAEYINKMNAEILKVIRESGGYNDKRIVLLPTMTAIASEPVLSKYEFPNDLYCMACVHPYVPNEFVLGLDYDDYDFSKFNGHSENAVHEMFQNLDKFFISKDIPFVIGETGPVMERERSERIKWVECYVSEAKTRGIPTAFCYGIDELDPISLIWNDPAYFDFIITTYGKTPGKNYIKKLPYYSNSDFHLSVVTESGDGWWTWSVKNYNNSYPFKELQKADAIIFECESDVLETWGDHFIIQYITSDGWDAGAEYSYPQSSRITVEDNKVVFDKRNLKPALHIGMGGGNPNWHDTLKRIYLEKYFDSTHSAWSLPYLQTAYANDLIPDTLMKNFKANTTRGEFASMLVPALEKALGKIDYSGVTAPDSKDADVLKCIKIGIMTGVDDKGTIQPSRALNRQEAALMLTKALRVLGYDDKAVDVTYADTSKIDSWALDGVKNMKGYGIMVGSDTGFLPKDPYTREACIVTVAKLFETIADN